MKAIVLSRKHALDIIDVVKSSRTDHWRISEAEKWLTYGSKDLNPFDVFEQHEKEMIIEALQHSALAYRKVGHSEEVERAKKFEALANQARAV
jgi:hypothetical protein